MSPRLPSTNRLRFEIIRDYLREIFIDDILNSRQIPVAIFCNKQDHPEKLEKANIKKILGVDDLVIRPGIKFSLRTGSGNEGSGVSDALDWLSKNIRSRRRKPGNEDNF